MCGGAGAPRCGCLFQHVAETLTLTRLPPSGWSLDREVEGIRMGPWHPPAARLRYVGVRSRLAWTSRWGKCSRIRARCSNRAQAATFPQARPAQHPGPQYRPAPSQGREQPTGHFDRMTLRLHRPRHRTSAAALGLLTAASMPSLTPALPRAGPRRTTEPWTWPLDPAAIRCRAVRPPEEQWGSGASRHRPGRTASDNPCTPSTTAS